MWTNKKVMQFALFFLYSLINSRLQLTAWCSAKHADLKAKPCIYYLLPSNCGPIPEILWDSIPHLKNWDNNPYTSKGCLTFLEDILHTKGLIYSKCSIKMLAFSAELKLSDRKAFNKGTLWIHWHLPWIFSAFAWLSELVVSYGVSLQILFWFKWF